MRVPLPRSWPLASGFLNESYGMHSFAHTKVLATSWLDKPCLTQAYATRIRQHPVAPLPYRVLIYRPHRACHRDLLWGLPTGYGVCRSWLRKLPRPVKRSGRHRLPSGPIKMLVPPRSTLTHLCRANEILKSLSG